MTPIKISIPLKIPLLSIKIDRNPKSSRQTVKQTSYNESYTRLKTSQFANYQKALENKLKLDKIYFSNR